MCAESGPELSEGNEDDMKTFNEDIVCCHGDVPLSSADQMHMTSALCCMRHRQSMCVPSAGGLSIQETERKLVSPEVWAKLRKYFPKAPEFSQSQEACQQCLVRRLMGWLTSLSLQSCYENLLTGCSITPWSGTCCSNV